MPAAALDIHGGVGATSKYTDNSRRAHTLAEHDWIHTPRVDLRAEQTNRAFNVFADYRLESRQYKNDTASDETLLTGEARLDAQVLGDQVRWFADLHRYESAIDSRLQTTPINRQVTNVIATGPRFRWEVTPRNSLDVTLQYQTANASRTGNDSSRFAVDAHVAHKIGEVNAVGLSLNATDVKFQSQFGNDYQREDARLTYQRDRGETSKLNVELGGSVLNRERGSTQRNWVGKLGGTFRFSRQWSVSLTGARDVTDQAQQNLHGVSQYGDQNNQRSDIAQAYVASSASASVVRAGERLSLTWTVGLTRQNFFARQILTGPGRDESRRTTALRWTYRFGPRVTLDAYGSLQVLDFQSRDGHDVERDGGMRLSWRPGRNISADLDLNAATRDSRSLPANFIEHSASISLGYRY